MLCQRAKYSTLFYVLFIHVYLSECFFNEFRDKNDENFTKEEVGPLFLPNPPWNPGDLPLLNRKIFKGTRVAIREHPYIASVRRHIAHYSVASMLTKNVFVTVAHPLVDVPVNELSVVVGENYADRGATLLSVVLVIIHEDFNKYTFKADIALIRVYEDSGYRCAVKSIQLIEPPAFLDQQTAFVTGWGRCDRTGKELCLPRSCRYTPGERFDPMLRTISFTIHEPNYYCEGYHRNGVHLSNGMLCFGIARETDKVAPCLAVPGAPLVVKAHLVAIQSWGFGCGYDFDLPLVYTSMQYYQPWILHNIPILRKVTQKDIKPIFEVLRAHILANWFYLTRVIPPPKPQISDKSLEPLPVDKVLAMLRGNVFDIRDIIFNGTQHTNKKRMYERLKRKMVEKEIYPNELYVHTRAEGIPFLSPNMTKKPSKLKKINVEAGMNLIDDLDRGDSDSDRSYGENEYA